ncbi:MAG TPA: hypothetical protein PKW63_01515 [Vicinamibacterales bacterium]|nr:hypothetical protein [Vicinamibacterales bacterium]
MAGKVNNRVAYSDMAAVMGIKSARESMVPGVKPRAETHAPDVDVDAGELSEISDRIAEIELDIEAFVDPHGKRVKIAERRAEMAKAMRDYLKAFEDEEIMLRVKTNQILETEQAEYARLAELKARLAALVKQRDGVREAGTKTV